MGWGGVGWSKGKIFGSCNSSKRLPRAAAAGMGAPVASARGATHAAADKQWVAEGLLANKAAATRGGGSEGDGRHENDVKRDHCTALRAVQHPSMTPTSLLGVWG